MGDSVQLSTEDRKFFLPKINHRPKAEFGCHKMKGQGCLKAPLLRTSHVRPENSRGWARVAEKPQLLPEPDTEEEAALGGPRMLWTECLCPVPPPTPHPPNSYVKALNPSVVMFGAGTFKEVITVK